MKHIESGNAVIVKTLLKRKRIAESMNVNVRTVNVLRQSFSYLSQNVLKGLSKTFFAEQGICAGVPRVTRTVVSRSLCLLSLY